ncbi:DUF262 domain-containing protein [Anaerolineales bacterium HSG25]|nr:DUF262 domain-containing protein [Anaerolineales bacterium HSG25]
MARDIEDSEKKLDHYAGDTVEFWEAKQRELITSVVDYNLATLTDLIENKEINLIPGYQRRFRWDQVRKSRLLESFLMNVPVPPIFLNEDAYGTYSIIDGKQRLSAIADYLRDAFPLEGLEVFGDINGRYYSDLPPTLQRVLRTRPTLRAIIILRQSDQDIKFEVFHRLNTGGVSLNPQEIRNNLFPGSLNDLIMELSITPLFHRLLGVKKKERSSVYQEMRDAEFVLRFFTFKDTWQTFKGGMKRHMDEFMSTYQDSDEAHLRKMRSDFLRTVKTVFNAFGDKAMRRWQPQKKSWRNQILAALFDAQMLACYKFSPSDFEGKTSEIQEALPKLFEDSTFAGAIQGPTNTPSYVRNRIEKMIEFLDGFTD